MWNYTDRVMDHFLNPRNVGEIKDPDGEATVGNISCGDTLKLTFKLDDNGKIAEVKFKTFGCGSAIASSSVLTEMVKGKTIAEAEKITNKEIVEALGGLPEEKIHCSVMGMEALQAAIANYRGEKIETDENEADHHGKIVCHCFGVTDTKIRRLVKENNLKTLKDVTNYSKAGGACGRCHGEINRILQEIWNAEAEKKVDVEVPFSNMTFIQKVLRIQATIDKNIKPLLEKDGGSVEFIDLKDSCVIVKMKGRCAMCPNTGLTIKNTVEQRLKDCISPDLTVKLE